MILCPSLLYLAAGFLSFDFQHLLIRHLAIFIERLSCSVTKILTAVNETRKLGPPRDTLNARENEFQKWSQHGYVTCKNSLTFLLYVPLAPLFLQ